MQRCPGSQSREVSHALWQRWNAHTNGDSQSVLIAQPAARVAVFGCSESEHAEATNRPERTKTSDLSRVPIVAESAFPGSRRQVFAYPPE